MLELFKEDIPRLDKLTIVVKQMIRNPKYCLDDIKEEIVDHISEFREIHPDDDEKLGEAITVAYSVIDYLIDDLDEDETNYQRIKNYISEYHSYNGFNRLINDFQDIITAEERKQLIDKSKKIFVAEFTEHWD